MEGTDSSLIVKEGLKLPLHGEEGRGPYSGVPAARAGCFAASEWLEISDTIRRYHELTHVICHRLYPGDIATVRDELVADAVGIYAAYEHFDPALEMLFLGLEEGAYTGGRLGNYTDRPEQIAGSVCQALDRIKTIIDGRRGAEPFELIEDLMCVIGDVSL